MSLKQQLTIILLLSGIGVVRIITTYGVFNQTVDEPTHVACGMEWLDRGSYKYGPEHPPLARIAAAIGPYLYGIRSFGKSNVVDEGNEILHTQGLYFRNLTLSRMGELPFFLLAIVIVWLWSRKLSGGLTAILSSGLFANLPPILGHAALATTDMALSATLTMSLFAFTVWLSWPTVGRSFFLGIAIGLAVLSKFSAIVFFPSCAITIVIFRLVMEKKSPGALSLFNRARMKAFMLSVLIVFIVVWAGYRFSIAPLTRPEARPHQVMDWLVGNEGRLHDLSYSISESFVCPAPALPEGIHRVVEHNSNGHRSYLLGDIRDRGWWYFFFVALAVKTPIAFIILTLIGVIFIVRRGISERQYSPFIPLICALVILVVCLPSSLNLGIRYILPIYCFFSIIAGNGAAHLWNFPRIRPFGSILSIILLGWYAMTSFMSHPDYLAYFNEAAGSHPERILLNSDLDWGQDLRSPSPLE
jgi:4-amino-4-deoxy-L-arabinose transferase-like glycosyltransferase